MNDTEACNVASIYIIGVPYHVDRLYDYRIPPAVKNDIRRGSLVTVPFGRSSRKTYAIVDSLHYKELSQLPAYLKPILTVDPEIYLDEHFIGLCHFMKSKFLCSFGDAVKCILPTAVFTKIQESYTALPYSDSREKISAKALAVYDAVASTKSMSVDALIKKFGSEVVSILPSLVELGYLEKNVTNARKNVKKVEYVHLVPDNDMAYGMILSKEIKGIKQITLVEHLIKNGSTSVDDLRDALGISRATVLSLCNKNIVEIEEREVNRIPYNKKSRTSDIVLSDEQQRAYDTVSALIDEKKAAGALLFGVTGSGKTSVIKKAIDKVLSQGRQVIMLVPEIALTPQAVDVFCSYYGDKVALIHSSLSEGERFDAFRRIQSGSASICIGTRSAVFAPFNNIGLIVIDEEHEHTYKSESNPKYHAKDIARYRCASSNALMLLASATPSVETYYKAEKGNYTLIKLTERYSGATLPETLICDMRVEAGSGNVSPMGAVMHDAIAKTVQKGEQAIIFVNRRGYNNYVSCPLCGFVQKCEKCSVSMTYHSFKKGSSNGYLICHYCGSRKELPKTCPECGSDRLGFMGFGTQKAEEEISGSFENARILRMDADTTSSKFSFDKMLTSFRNKKADILIGTQMVSKGHDFPNVTLVGILLADSSLYLDDYRANERTFSLITQVVGRAGRAAKKGIAVIQTYNPEHPVIKLAALQSYEEFYKNEIALRKNYLFPPFCDIALFTFSTTEEAAFKSLLPKFHSRISELCKDEFSDVPLISFGPFEAPVYRVNNTYRMRYVFKCKDNNRTRQLFAKLYCEFAKSESNKLTISVDINPNTL